MANNSKTLAFKATEEPDRLLMTVSVKVEAKSIMNDHPDGASTRRIRDEKDLIDFLLAV